jgi:hypothetical protein
MNEEQKKQVLLNLHRIDAETIWEYIKSGYFTFPELKETGKLTRDKQDYILEKQKDIIIKGNAEKTFWEDCCAEHKIKAYNRYKNAYPGGIYVSQADALIAEIIAENAKRKRQILNEMDWHPERFNPTRLQDIFDEEIIDESDLIEEGIITENALKLYMNPPRQIFMNQQDWKQLENRAMPDGCTDMYFFGIPGSGKSCVLAGLLYLADRKGILTPDINNKVGLRYLNELKHCIRIGYVPDATAEDTLNYLSFKLTGKETHPISVVEMSGEFFNRTYEEMIGASSNNGAKTISANGWLSNNNRKAIFFIIDYKADFSDATIQFTENQSDMLTAALELLAKDGTLVKTDSIQVIMTKSDFMPEGEDRENCARMFLNDNYRSFMRNLEEKCKKYGINKTRNYRPVILPFSLGRFMLGKTFEYDEKDSATLVLNLLNLTATDRKGKWYEELFS